MTETFVRPQAPWAPHLLPPFPAIASRRCMALAARLETSTSPRVGRSRKDVDPSFSAEVLRFANSRPLQRAPRSHQPCRRHRHRRHRSVSRPSPPWSPSIAWCARLRANRRPAQSLDPQPGDGRHRRRGRSHRSHGARERLYRRPAAQPGNTRTNVRLSRRIFAHAGSLRRLRLRPARHRARSL